jgi:aminoglycoside 6'-N-acetyltransferase I
MPMQIRPYRDRDWPEWLRLSLALFPHDAGELTPDMERFRGRDDAEVFVVDRGDGMLAGFVEVGARSVADGCETSPVGYIEAWFVDPDLRRQGHGLALLAAAEGWARDRGYIEHASDALLDNTVSHAAHRRAGYQEGDRLVTFRKVLDDGALPRR